jgi:hypothetical protein
MMLWVARAILLLLVEGEGHGVQDKGRRVGNAGWGAARCRVEGVGWSMESVKGRGKGQGVCSILQGARARGLLDIILQECESLRARAPLCEEPVEDVDKLFDFLF